MTGLRRVPRWLRLALLLGLPMAFGVSTIHLIGDRLWGCGTAPAGVEYWASMSLVYIPLIGAAAAGWWGSQGVGARHGCLAGLVYGLLVAAGLIAASIVDF